MSGYQASQALVSPSAPSEVIVSGAPLNNPIDMAGVLVAIAVASGLWRLRRRRKIEGPELSWLFDALNVVTVELLGFLTVATFIPARPWLIHAIAGASQLLPIIFLYCAGLIVRQMLRSIASPSKQEKDAPEGS